MRLDDTIAAISSATGPAARMIVRLSGPDALSLIRQICQQPPDQPSTARRCPLNFAGLQFSAWIYRFDSPRSFTGQDLLELHIPGNPLLARMLLDHLLRLGARSAEPGEFTARAYFGGRIDLSQAEGVAATISAGNQRQLDAARRLLAGELSRRLRPTLDALADLLALIEAEIDFSEEDVRFLAPAEMAKRLARITSDLQTLRRESGRMDRLGHEPTIVLAGRPNAGKSTLINALAGSARSIVSPVAGTTRDVLTATVIFPRGLVRLIDMAGLESGDAPPADSIESKMQSMAMRAIEESDVIVLLRDSTDPRPPLDLPRRADLVVATKCDLFRATDFKPSPGTPGEGLGEGLRWNGGISKPSPRPSPGVPGEGVDCPADLHVSAITGENLPELRELLDRVVFGVSAADATLALGVRHLQAIDDALECLSRAESQIESSPELLAADLRQALDSLGGILGAVTPDDVLGRVFATFCIGK